MCTVTYIPLSKNNFLLTSNRDETPLRKTIPPRTYYEDGVAITYPKDALAGGTWIGVSDKNRVICLLNGAFETHERKSTYRISRGVIVKNLLKCEAVESAIERFDFEDIEPFTLISVDWQRGLQALEFVWNGKTKHVQHLNESPKIWSSSPLYDAEMKEERHSWFRHLINTKENISDRDVLDFHQSGQTNNLKNSIKMKRPVVETVSTTQIKKEGDEVTITYFDYLEPSKKGQMKLKAQQ